MGLLGPRLPIDVDELEWQLATFKWLIAEFGEAGDTPLVLPTPQWFPRSEASGDAEIADLFGHVRRAAGMEQWPCELVAGDQDRPTYAGNALLLRHEGAAAPCGTFQVAGEDGSPRILISYNPGLAADTMALVATFAHELGHYLMSTASSPPPGGWELHELHTDLVAVYLGFGIFLANSARSFSQFQSGGEMGWSSRTQGYLSEGALVTALTIFQRLAGRDPADAAPYLKAYLAKDLKSASAWLAKRHPDMPASVRAVDLSDYAGQ
ncbi:MAG TPA: hypothetical protein VGW34_10180 [Allosphingosinicella sp.]|nr:hypothetical protein [Allosphingosinicella sp.]